MSVRLSFTGRSAWIIRDALALAADELQNQIATCPNVVVYADDIDDLEEEKAEILKLLARVDKLLVKAPRV